MHRFEKVEQFINHVLLLEKGIPSCDITIMKDHELIYRYYAGFSDLAARTPVDPNAHYFLYSCTKPITAAAAMTLVEAGKLDLYSPVSEYLPSFSNLKVLKNGELKRAETDLTVLHLFTMTGGYDYSISTDPYVKELLAQKGSMATTMDIVNAYAKRPLLFEPGTEFEYSICHDILAGVVEAVSGKRFCDYVDEVVFSPLGMKHTTFRHTDETKQNVVTQYTYDGEQIRPIEKNNGFIVTPNYDSGGAGLISCPEDYILFADTLACEGVSRNGYHLLDAETIKMMSNVYVSSEMLGRRRQIMGCGPDYGYGLGVRTRVSTTGHSSPIGEFGWDGAAGSYVLIDTANHLSIFLAMHVKNWAACIGKSHQVLRDLIYECLAK